MRGLLYVTQGLTAATQHNPSKWLVEACLALEAPTCPTSTHKHNRQPKLKVHIGCPNHHPARTDQHRLRHKHTCHFANTATKGLIVGLLFGWDANCIHSQDGPAAFQLRTPAHAHLDHSMHGANRHLDAVLQQLCNKQCLLLSTSNPSYRTIHIGLNLASTPPPRTQPWA